MGRHFLVADKKVPKEAAGEAVELIAPAIKATSPDPSRRAFSFLLYFVFSPPGAVLFAGVCPFFTENREVALQEIQCGGGGNELQVFVLGFVAGADETALHPMTKAGQQFVMEHTGGLGQVRHCDGFLAVAA